MKTLNCVSAYFEADHARLDAVFKQFQQVKESSVAESKPYFRIFNNGLKRHIVWEEDLLFPAYENHTGVRDSGPTEVMRQEHRQIGATLEAIHDKIRRGQSDTQVEEARLLEILGDHNRKEEKILYPAINASLGEEEVASLFVAMESIPPERYANCCGGAH